jgi:hypothetical protein
VAWPGEGEEKTMGENESPGDARLTQKFGFEIFHDDLLTAFIRGRWRLLWYNPRYRDSWTVDGIFDQSTWQVELGPVVVVYIRSDNY